jgi:organic hydroperoxide reductase OsmC/OhrA
MVHSQRLTIALRALKMSATITLMKEADMSVAHTSKIQVAKHEGPHRTALIEGFDEPLHLGIHGGIKHFYQEKYGREITGPEYPATLDHMIAGVAGWLLGTFGAALDVRKIKSAENLVADVEGDIEEVDGVLKITSIRLHYRLTIPKGCRDKVDRVLATYFDKCPAYQSVKGCIECTWDADVTEE